jgi:hypothetical protein
MLPATIFGDFGGVLGSLLDTVKGLAVVALPVVGALIGRTIQDSHKRELLREVAQGAVAAALLKWPNIASDQLVQEITTAILQQPSPPTTNKDAVTRAVASALALQKQANNVATAAGHPGA